jgi:hypothetical protein
MNRTVALIAVGITAILLVSSLVWSADQPPATQRIPQFENAHVKVWKSTIVRMRHYHCIATTTVE